MINSFLSTGYKDQDRANLINFWLVDYSPSGNRGRCDYEVYKTYSNATYLNFEFTGTSCYFPETDQEQVQLRLHRKRPLKEVWKELKLWLPYVKPITTKQVPEPHLQIDILEHDLSKYASWHLEILLTDDEVDLGSRSRVANYRYHSYNVKLETTLKECLKYIKKELWYE